MTSKQLLFCTIYYFGGQNLASFKKLPIFNFSIQQYTFSW